MIDTKIVKKDDIPFLKITRYCNKPLNKSVQEMMKKLELLKDGDSLVIKVSDRKEALSLKSGLMYWQQKIYKKNIFKSVINSDNTEIYIFKI